MGIRADNERLFLPEQLKGIIISVGQWVWEETLSDRYRLSVAKAMGVTVA
jgi:hypothetical protein